VNRRPRSLVKDLGLPFKKKQDQVKESKMHQREVVLTRILALAQMLLPIFAIAADYRPSFEDIKGARFNNKLKATWDIAWSEDVHPKGIERRECQLSDVESAAGASLSLGRPHYSVWALEEVDLYLLGLETEARELRIWLSVDDKEITERAIVAVNGNGNYKVTVKLKRICRSEKVYVRASCKQGFRISKMLFYSPPKNLFPEGIQGVYLLKYANQSPADGKLKGGLPVAIKTGKQEWKLSDFLSSGKGIPMPRLGVSVDIGIGGAAMGDYYQRVYAEDGSVVRKSWRKMQTNPRVIPADQFCVTKALLDSRKLDSNGDGLWSAEILRSMDSKDVPAGMAYATIIPATWFDVPATADPYKILKFEYISQQGRKRMSIPLRDDYRNPDGSMRLGFLHFSTYLNALTGKSIHKAYIVCSCL